jgi:hypothetical protein
MIEGKTHREIAILVRALLEATGKNADVHAARLMEGERIACTVFRGRFSSTGRSGVLSMFHRNCTHDERHWDATRS